ncbi:hypothetical protein L873DRAFT_1703114 [Choiromyces venosus 120613-1]|uniref:Uncharacterized protein n=1 Tax=Choiromyces venosus 120613-1 TaxID=1336337 RepID=A0A3N4J6N1_9PEZI|nr:hypothetical protein L873DRAFT_1703114 [Choiromyces venosus 120613-1]
MSNKNLKDQRRSDLIIPYVAPAAKADETDIAATISSTLPMAAKNETNYIRTSVLFAIQAWLNETPAQVAGGKQPAYFGVGMSLMALGFSYLPLFIPSMGAGPLGMGSTTAPAEATPA